MQKIDKFIPIQKVDDEQRMVWGYASTPDLDSDGEIIELNAIEKALPEYMKFPTIREMHQPKAAGRTVEATIDNKGLFIGAKIVSDEAWNMVKEGVYAGFSIAGKVVQKLRNRISELKLTEISLVDVPANKSAVITLWKSEGGSEHPLIIALRDIEFESGSIEDKLREGVIRMAEEKIAEQNAEQNEEQEEEVVEAEETKEAEVVEEAQAQEDEAVESTDEDAEANADAEEVEETTDEEPEVVVDEAKEASDQPSDITKTLEVLISKVEALTAEKQVEKAEDTELQKMQKRYAELEKRINELENTPMPVKAQAGYTVIAKNEEPVEDNELARIEKRLDEIDAIKERNLTQYQNEYMTEALELAARKRSLTNSIERGGENG